MSYIQCKKFEPNRFSRIRCQNCFAAKNHHTPEALERKTCSTKATHCGYLFISQDSDFSTALSKSRRWIRRYFVVFNDGHLKYFLDENIDGVPVADEDLAGIRGVLEAEEITTHANSLKLSFHSADVFIKGVSREEIRRWGDIFKGFLKNDSHGEDQWRKRGSFKVTRSKEGRSVLTSSNSAESDWKSTSPADSVQSAPGFITPDISGKLISELPKAESVVELNPKIPESQTRCNLYGESAELEGLFYQKSGWLMLNDKHTNEWIKCWCKLKNGQLSIKMDDASGVDLLVDVRKCEKVAELILPFSYGLVLETPNESMTFSVTTESSRDSWCSMLDSVMTHVTMAHVTITPFRPRSPEIPREHNSIEISVDKARRESLQTSEQQAIDSLVAQISGLQSQLSQVQADFESHCNLYCAERESSIEKINTLENERSELARRVEDVLEQYDKLSEEKEQIERSYLEATKLLEQRTEMYDMLRDRAAKMSLVSDDEPPEILTTPDGTFPHISTEDLSEKDRSVVETLLAVVKAREIHISSLKSQLSMVSGTLAEFHEELMVAIENYKSTEDHLRADNERIARMVSKSLEDIERDETAGGSINDCKLIHDLKVALCVKDFETQRLRAHVLMLEDEIVLVLAHEERTMKMYRLCLHEKNQLTSLYNTRLLEIRGFVDS